MNAGQPSAIDLLDAERMLKLHVATLVNERGGTVPRHRKVLRRFLDDLAGAADQAGRVLLDEARLVRWMIGDAEGRSPGSARVRLMIVARYVAALCRSGLLLADPAAQFRARHGNRRWADLVSALQADAPATALALLEPISTPPGPFASELRSYLEFQNSLGKQYDSYRRTLTELDRFLRAHQTLSLAAVTSTLIERWLASMTCSAAVRLRKARRVGRFFAHLLSLGRVADNPVSRLLVLSRRLPPRRRPFIFTTQQVSAILAAARQSKSGRTALWHAPTCFTMLMLLYGLGLRHGEARRLRIRDIDFARQTLFIDRSKFYKSRCLPFGPKVARCLQEFLAFRRTRLQPAREDDPLFVSWWRAPVSDHLLGDAFCAILRRLDIVSGGEHRPRLHDLRHNAACRIMPTRFAG
jgi:site-specific recombinase XerD